LWREKTDPCGNEYLCEHPGTLEDVGKEYVPDTNKAGDRAMEPPGS